MQNLVTYTLARASLSLVQHGMVFQTQVPISLVILAIGIQDLYISKYKYTIKVERTVIFTMNCGLNP